VIRGEKKLVGCYPREEGGRLRIRYQRENAGRLGRKGKEGGEKKKAREELGRGTLFNRATTLVGEENSS